MVSDANANCAYANDMNDSIEIAKSLGEIFTCTEEEEVSSIAKISYEIPSENNKKAINFHSGASLF